MAELQTTYATTLAAGYPGMVANGETSNRISRTCEDSGGIGFGKAVYAGAGDHGCTATQTLVGAGSEGPANVGTGTITDAPTVGAAAKRGRYVIQLLGTSSTAPFRVEDPDGNVVGEGNVATEFVGGGLTFTISNAGTMTAGDLFYVDVTGNGFLGISIAHEALGLLAGQTADKYQQYDNVAIMTQGVIFVTLGGSVSDRDQVSVDSSGDFVSGSGKALAGWTFDQTGVDNDIVKIAKR